MAVDDNTFRFQLGVPAGKPIPDWKKKAALQGKYGKLARKWAEEKFNEEKSSED